MPRKNGDRQGSVATKTRTKTKKPPMYRVVLLNDDYTPMDFVVLVLEHIFRRSRPDAVEIMLTVHMQGRGVAGIYPREVAETKLQQVVQAAQTEGHPLKCIIEPE